MINREEVIIEVCATSVMSAIAAEEGGAKRIELCDNIIEGGTTPSAGLIRMAKQKLDLDVCVLIRPRGGDFLYNDSEFDLIIQDIILAKELGADGVVVGILDSNGLVDMVRMKELINVARPMQVVFHRAFDMCLDPVICLEQIIDLGVDRLLTSGQKNRAIEGIDLIKELIVLANNRIEIMPGSGINTNNIKELLGTGAASFHLTGRSMVDGMMNYRQNTVILNDINSNADYQWKQTNKSIIKEIVRISNSL